jgi:uncharacterized protein
MFHARSWHAALAFAAVIAVCAPVKTTLAAETGFGPRTISVNGEGEVFAKPDTARFAAAVVTQAQTAEAATAANSEAMNRVFAALNQLGIPANKVQTSNFSVQPQYPPFRADAPAAPRTITGYQVSNQVTVTVDDLSKLGPALDLLVRSGANQVGSVFFSVADPKPLAQRARAEAVADAAAKARTLATAAGVTLGPLLAIQEGPGLIRPVAPLALRQAEAAAPPIAAGEQPFIVTVTMTYGIQ